MVGLVRARALPPRGGRVRLDGPAVARSASGVRVRVACGVWVCRARVAVALSLSSNIYLCCSSRTSVFALRFRAKTARGPGAGRVPAYKFHVTTSFLKGSA